MVSHVYVLVWTILARSRGGGNNRGAVRRSDGSTRVQVSKQQAQPSAIHDTTRHLQMQRKRNEQMEPRQRSSDAAGVIQVRQHGVVGAAATCRAQTRP